MLAFSRRVWVRLISLAERTSKFSRLQRHDDDDDGDASNNLRPPNFPPYVRPRPALLRPAAANALASYNTVAMGHSAGLRAGTRYAFSRDFKKRGAIPLSTYLKTYK